MIPAGPAMTVRGMMHAAGGLGEAAVGVMPGLADAQAVAQQALGQQALERVKSLRGDV